MATIREIIRCQGAECYERNARAVRDKIPAISFITNQRGDIVPEMVEKPSSSFEQTYKEYHGPNFED